MNYSFSAPHFKTFLAITLLGFCPIAHSADVERTHEHRFSNYVNDFETWTRTHIDGARVLQGLHHFRVWGNTEDNCTFTSYGGDNSKSFDSILSGMEKSVSKPILSTSADLECEESKVECVAYTSDYRQYIGISMKGLDLSKTVITSTITLRVCANGRNSIEDESHVP